MGFLVVLCGVLSQTFRDSVTLCQTNTVLWHPSTLPVQLPAAGEEDDMAEFCGEQTLI